MSGKPQRGPKAATKVLRVRLTDAEWACIRVDAEQAGCSISEYVRRLVIGSPKKRR